MENWLSETGATSVRKIVLICDCPNQPEPSMRRIMLATLP